MLVEKENNLPVNFASCSRLAVINNQRTNSNADGLDGELKPK